MGGPAEVIGVLHLISAIAGARDLPCVCACLKDLPYFSMAQAILAFLVAMAMAARQKPRRSIRSLTQRLYRSCLFSRFAISARAPRTSGFACNYRCSEGGRAVGPVPMAPGVEPTSSSMESRLLRSPPNRIDPDYIMWRMAH